MAVQRAPPLYISGVNMPGKSGAGATVQVSGGRLEGKTVANVTVNLMSGYVGLSSVGGLVAMVRNGAFWVSSGAMNSAYVNDGGKLYMMQRATAKLVSVSSGGHCGVASGCIVSNANVGALAGSNRGTLGISSGGQPGQPRQTGSTAAPAPGLPKNPAGNCRTGAFNG